MTLNPEQKKAVALTEGPVMIIAGAGTGKTRVIIHRIAHLINSKQSEPENILALAFSTKAAEEMRTRMEYLLNVPLDLMHISTFHAFCADILYKFGRHIGLPSEITILEQVDCRIMLRSLFPSLKLHYFLERYDPRTTIEELNTFISRAKDELIDPSKYTSYVEKRAAEFERTKHSLTRIEREAFEEQIDQIKETALIYDAYEKKLAADGALDFGGMIMSTHTLFSRRPDILNNVQQRFQYILVDEFQDTNAAQVELLNCLAKSHNNICVVGDDDQSIYRFRGALHASFRWFQQTFSSCKTLMLNSNYRSTLNIVTCSSLTIQKNETSRLFSEKILTTENEPGEPVRYIVSPDYKHEAKTVADLLWEQFTVSRQREITENIAVLYRAHNHANLLVQECISRGIPYKILSPEPLFNQLEIKLLMSYMRILDESNDYTYLYIILTHHDWDLQTNDIIALFDFMQDNDYTPFEVLLNRGYEDILSPEGIGKINRIGRMLLKIYDESEHASAIDIFHRITQECGLTTRLLENPVDENEGVLRNIVSFYNLLFDYVEKSEDKSLSATMRYLSDYILAGGDPGKEEVLEPDPHSINFLTAHAAKSLEFDTVYIIGLSNRRFPTQRRKPKIQVPDELKREKIPAGDVHTEEERRLFYVAMTRAQKRLILSTVEKTGTPMSKFVRELIEDSRTQSILEEYIPQEASTLNNS